MVQICLKLHAAGRMQQLSSLVLGILESPFWVQPRKPGCPSLRAYTHRVGNGLHHVCPHRQKSCVVHGGDACVSAPGVEVPADLGRGQAAFGACVHNSGGATAQEWRGNGRNAGVEAIGRGAKMETKRARCNSARAIVKAQQCRSKRGACKCNRA
eukprot:scaffold188196_cov19-Tisochrysis_lutea.AAC.1